MKNTELNIQDILQDMLSRDPENGAQRNLIFWYDAEADFQHEIQSVSFNNTKVVTLSKNNAFRLKYDIEIAHPTSHFLLYAPFSKPQDRENWLLDIQKYATEFSSDRSVYEMNRLGVEDENLRPLFKKNIRFFDNGKRVTKLKSYAIDHYDPMTFQVAIVSALAKLKTVDFDEVIRILIHEHIAGEDTLIEEIEKFGDLKGFYTLLGKRFGLNEETFGFNHFIATLLYTAFSYQYQGKLPQRLEHLKSNRISEIVVFVDEFYHHSQYQDIALRLARIYEEKLGISKILNGVETEVLMNCDTFPLIDEIIMERIVIRIHQEVKDYEKSIRLVKERRSTHWYRHYQNEYQALIHGLELLKHYDQLAHQLSCSDLESYFERYCETYHKMDFYYRKFYYYYDRIKVNDMLSHLSELVENVYVNSFLGTLSINWSAAISERGDHLLDKRKIKRQWRFYDEYVEPYVISKERIFVIISDALRYEVANELVTELMKERRAEISITASQGVVPTETQFGMAALLPGDTMTYDPDRGIEIDGFSASGRQNRERILQTATPEAVAYRYESLRHMKKSDYKEAFTGKKLVYIYHDTLDRLGHQSSPFDAAEVAIEELKDLIRSLVNHVSATKILITADHGFLYQRSPLEEYDKISKVKSEAILTSDRRFLLSQEPFEDMNLLNLPMNESIKTKEELHVIVPKGSLRFKTQGGGGNFVHGGAMLQELVVPVITYFDKRSDDFKAKKVEVQLTSITRKLTNRISYLEFFQTESVSKKRLPLNLRLSIVDEEGTRVSNEVILIADRGSSEPQDRRFKEKFVLKDLPYKKEDTYYLLFEDDEETLNPVLNKIPFVIDLAIVNDFGF